VAWHPGSPGSKSGARTEGFPRNLGDLRISCARRTSWVRSIGEPGREAEQGCLVGANNVCTAGTTGQAQQGLGDGAGGVGAPRSTAEAGERDPFGPGGGKGVPSHAAVGGKDDGGIDP